MKIEEWARLTKTVQELAQWFPDTVTFIGGIAIWAHCMERQNSNLAAMTHDGDFVIGLFEFSDLKELEVVSENSRLGIHEFSKNGFSFDVYAERQNKLLVPADEIISESQVALGVRVANLGHLLKLKAVAAIDRKDSAKGNKDMDDLVRILICMKGQEVPANVARLEDEELLIIEEAVKGESVVRMSKGNLFAAKKLRQNAKSVLEAVVAKANDPDGNDRYEP